MTAMICAMFNARLTAMINSISFATLDVHTRARMRIVSHARVCGTSSIHAFDHTYTRKETQRDVRIKP